jgi:hypothetical protein
MHLDDPDGRQWAGLNAAFDILGAWWTSSLLALHARIKALTSRGIR